LARREAIRPDVEDDRHALGRPTGPVWPVRRDDLDELGIDPIGIDRTRDHDVTPSLRVSSTTDYFDE